MVDLIVLFPTLMTTVMTPFSLFKSVVILSLKTLLILVHTWVGLVKATINFHLSMFRRTMICMIALILLPIRVVTALQRERLTLERENNQRALSLLLEDHLHEMQIMLDNLVWEMNELEDQLQTAVRDRRLLESLLAEVEEENDVAITKIEFLEVELQDLKAETLQLKELQGKGHWSFQGQDNTGSDQNIGITDDSGTFGTESWQSSYKGSGIILQDMTIQTDVLEAEGNNKAKLLNFLRTRFAAGVFSRNTDVNEVLETRREVALTRSLFSAVLSIFVGMVVWEAEDFCLPLVAALFTVVGMSLMSVVQFFSTVKSKPASDAVMLLCLNCFILGALSYPTLPRVACWLAPLALKFLNWMLTSLHVTPH